MLNDRGWHHIITMSHTTQWVNVINLVEDSLPEIEQMLQEFGICDDYDMIAGMYTCFWISHWLLLILTCRKLSNALSGVQFIRE